MTDPSLDPKTTKLLKEYAALDPDQLRLFHQAAIQGEEIQDETADPWQPFTLADAYLDRPPIEYVVSGIFSLPSLNIVYAAPGTLKSFVLADMAVCVAAGEIWLTPAPWRPGDAGLPGIKTTKAPVMWLDFDNGARRTHERIGALARARDLPTDTPIYYYSMPTPWLNASSAESTGMLTLRAKTLGARLIVIDNLGNISGGVDENSGQMIAVMSYLRQLAEETGAAVVVVHHQRKGNGFGGRAGDTLRGHSSIEAALDLALQVTRESSSDTISIRSTKTRGVDVYPFSAVFTYEHKDNGDLDTARFYSLITEDTSSNAAIEREILAALEGAELNKTNLKAAVKEELPEIGIHRIGDMIDRLAAKGTIKAHPGRNNTERIYTK